MPEDDTPRLNPAYLNNWETQYQGDLGLARIAENNNFYEWACYLSQQAAEKAVKSVLFKLQTIPPYNLKRHSIFFLAGFIPKGLFNGLDYGQFEDDCKELFAHVESARYPAIDGPHCPRLVYTQNAAVVAIEQAERVIEVIGRIKAKIR
jgi:HEPN domain-containing protein